jgi:hypothetical protein
MKPHQWLHNKSKQQGNTGTTWYILQNRTLAAIVLAEEAQALQVQGDLDRCWGIGPGRLRSYGHELFQILKANRQK